MARWGMVIDLDRCTGCQACVVACQAENNQPVPNAADAAKGRTISWMRLLPFVEGEYPRVKMRLLPRPCMQCEHPPCVKVCPVDAFKLEGKSPKSVSRTECITCLECQSVCRDGSLAYGFRPFGRGPEESSGGQDAAESRDERNET